MNVTETGYQVMDWIHLAHDTDHLRVLMITTINVRS
jgi:hypothetical protein